MNRSLACATVLSVVFVAYASLYPFELRALAPDAFAQLLATASHPIDSWINLLSNILFYMPFGFLATTALRRAEIKPISTAVGITIAGAALSVLMELTQMHVAGRLSTFADIYPNTAGAGFGACLGVAARLWAIRPRGGIASIAPVPALLLALFLAYRLFPYVPSLDVHAYWRAVQPLIVHPRLELFEMLHYAVMWFAVAVLLRRLSLPWQVPGLALLLMGAVWVAKILILHNQLTASEAVGGIAGLIAWAILGRAGDRRVAAMTALVLGLWIVASRLTPFVFTAHSSAFGWVPFAALMQGSMSINTIALLEKSFVYGTMLWALGRAGLRLPAGAASLAAMLALLAWLQTHIPGRSADITDAAIALAMAVIIALLTATVGVPTAEPQKPTVRYKRRPRMRDVA